MSIPGLIKYYTTESRADLCFKCQKCGYVTANRRFMIGHMGTKHQIFKAKKKAKCETLPFVQVVETRDILL